MFNPVECFIAMRYTRSERRNRFVSFGSLISMLGVGLGVTALITVLAVMNGFENELRDRILGATAHISVGARQGQMQQWQTLRKQVLEVPRVAAAAPYVTGEAMFRRGESISGGMVRGVLPQQEVRVSELREEVRYGTTDALQDGQYRILLGRVLAQNLGVTVGDTVDVLVPQALSSPLGLMPRMRRFVVAGLLSTGMYDFDRSLAVTHIADAARLYSLGDGVSGLRLRIKKKHLFDAPTIAQAVQDRLGPAYFALDWTAQHGNFFQALRTEKTVMFVILALIVAVAAFNIVATLVMAVVEKRGDIAILRTIGLSPYSIMAIFVLQGVVITCIGVACGVMGGIILSDHINAVANFLEHTFQLRLVPADVYGIGSLPSRLKAGDVLRIVALALGLGLLATLYPAWRAAMGQPAEALRYE